MGKINISSESLHIAMTTAWHICGEKLTLLYMSLLREKQSRTVCGVNRGDSTYGQTSQSKRPSLKHIQLQCTVQVKGKIVLKNILWWKFKISKAVYVNTVQLGYLLTACSIAEKNKLFKSKSGRYRSIQAKRACWLMRDWSHDWWWVGHGVVQARLVKPGRPGYRPGPPTHTTILPLPWGTSTV